MTFRTKIDFTNRQTKQYEKTDVSLSGKTTFGLPYSALTSGPNLTMSGITFEDPVVTSTFSGNTGTTVYTFGDSRMTLAEGDLSAITPLNSGTTQSVGPIFEGYDSFVTVDGYSGYNSYSGVSYDIIVQSMDNLGGGSYSGVVESELSILSASSLDWSGSTIWVDVSGVTRTNELMVTKGINIGHVLTCIDSNGRAAWLPSSGSTGALSVDKNNSIIIGGVNNQIVSGASNSVIIGGQNITGNTSDVVYVPDLVIDGLISTDPLTTDINGKIVAQPSDIRLKTNVNVLENSLDVINKLRGVSYEWTKESNMGTGVTKFGFIAQEVKDVIPEMVHKRSKGGDMLTLNYTELIPWMIEAIKELNGSKDKLISNDSEFKVDEFGRWIATPALSSKHMILPVFTPTSTNDDRGMLGDAAWDDNHIYIKTNDGWKRSSLENF